ncbi:MAG: acetylxylan esterase [Planctomycetia bacterium]|nr:acetylxylan esterase [Planctomycetia bacterium]
MKNRSLPIFLLVLILCGAEAVFAQYQANYDESKVPDYTLPNPLVCEDGSVVTNAAQWEAKRRPEIFALFEKEMYGELPSLLREAGNHPDFVTFRTVETCDDALGGLAIRKQTILTFSSLDGKEKVDVNLLLYVPKDAPQPTPVFLGMNFLGNHTITKDPNVLLHHLRSGEKATSEAELPEGSRRGDRVNRWAVEKILKSGYALAVFHYVDVAKDGAQQCFTSGVFDLYSDYEGNQSRGKNDWGAISAWAWGASRALDYLETEPLVDASRVAIMGHSRLGKTALWTGASDPRFALVISNDSGCGGAALSRREFGESVRIINRNLYYWFAPQFTQYNERVNDLPIDQHELVALIAPRPVYIASAEEDLWADPLGEYLSALHAVPVYELYGDAPFGNRTEEQLPNLHEQVGKTIGYHIRAGKHDVTEFDWEMYIRFADKHLKK